MKVSVIVPTYNEEQDIRETLESLIALRYNNKEIIFVDDSTDHTSHIISQYRLYGVQLIRPKTRAGRCGARNIGIRQSTGEVVIILNADVRLPADFIERILVHYDNGFDYVLVKAEVFNMGDVFARYVEAIARREEEEMGTDWIEWTEGFSCRREMAIQAGLFPDGYPVHICAGEDGFFGDNLRKLGALRRLDYNIVVRHVAPASFHDFWTIRKGRGQGTPQVHRYLHRWSMPRIVLWAILRSLLTGACIVTLVPTLCFAFKASRCSPRGFRDWIPFAWARAIEAVAYSVGEWSSIRAILSAEKRAY